MLITFFDVRSNRVINGVDVRLRSIHPQRRGARGRQQCDVGDPGRRIHHLDFALQAEFLVLLDKPDAIGAGHQHGHDVHIAPQPADKGPKIRGANRVVDLLHHFPTGFFKGPGKAHHQLNGTHSVASDDRDGTGL